MNDAQLSCSINRPQHVPPASRRILGRYLVEEGYISVEDLQAALDLMRLTNVSAQELARARGWPWPTLSDQRLQALKWEADLRNLRLGDALVEIGAVSATSMDELVRRFELARADVEPLHV